MKRLLLFLLTASLLLTSMTGCLLGGPQNNETTPEQGTPFGTTPSLPEDLTTPPPEETTAEGITCDTSHTYNDGVVTEDVILYTCLTCGETKTVEVPVDFAFSLTWGFDGAYDSKTGLLKNGYNYQLGVDCETTLILTREELMNVYRLLYNANAFAIKEDFTVSKILGHPSYRVKFSYSVGCEVFKFTIDGESFVGDYSDWEVHQEFGYAYYQIVDFIKSTEEYKALPPNTNAYD